VTIVCIVCGELEQSTNGSHKVHENFTVVFIHRVSHGRRRNTVNRYTRGKKIQENTYKKNIHIPQPGNGQVPTYYIICTILLYRKHSIQRDIIAIELNSYTCCFMALMTNT